MKFNLLLYGAGISLIGIAASAVQGAPVDVSVVGFNWFAALVAVSGAIALYAVLRNAKPGVV